MATLTRDEMKNVTVTPDQVANLKVCTVCIIPKRHFIIRVWYTEYINENAAIHVYFKTVPDIIDAPFYDTGIGYVANDIANANLHFYKFIKHKMYNISVDSDEADAANLIRDASLAANTAANSAFGGAAWTKTRGQKHVGGAAWTKTRGQKHVGGAQRLIQPILDNATKTMYEVVLVLNQKACREVYIHTNDGKTDNIFSINARKDGEDLMLNAYYTDGDEHDDGNEYDDDDVRFQLLDKPDADKTIAKFVDSITAYIDKSTVPVEPNIRGGRRGGKQTNKRSKQKRNRTFRN